jgi:hypothetical protein
MGLPSGYVRFAGAHDSRAGPEDHADVAMAAKIGVAVASAGFSPR